MHFVSPQSLDEAARHLAEGGGKARILAGGTDLLVQMKSGMISPETVIDIKRIPGMRDITAEDGGFRVGAGVPGQQLNEHEGVKALWPGVVEACDLIGSTQIQGRCTMVGNLCNGSPAADSVPAMAAANAVARVVGPKGERDVPVAELPQGPGKLALEDGEFVASVFLPARPGRAADAYLRFTPRTEMDIAVASAAVSLELAQDGTISDARVVLGAVGPKINVVDAAAKAIIGTTLDDAALDKMAAACRDAAQPIDDKRGTVEFRTQVAGVLASRAARIAKDRAEKKAGDRS
ncbi:xanthine dehydrogenase family protein subunit M [Roseovarius sp. SCSIO 43702]|uniref:FAD binding domain-containing protein n=1 Tax=Roseovarius sp. SCSIO 43702 TaxID=2823043 RepID=UPI001C73D487|nr:xanthine dehydrogenase family protein subunit M [Roseovarius sp. SCSIO 43702]QYX58320.1 xanthine dehydrogenase family protein subunit M [Roseovarius sp. SCSIO 43702]